MLEGSVATRTERLSSFSQGAVRHPESSSLEPKIRGFRALGLGFLGLGFLGFGSIGF